jgi:hypothetical protein
MVNNVINPQLNLWPSERLVGMNKIIETNISMRGIIQAIEPAAISRIGEVAICSLKRL